MACTHIGCLWEAPCIKDEELLAIHVAEHVSCRRTHARHFLECKSECNTCQRLVENGSWPASLPAKRKRYTIFFPLFNHLSRILTQTWSSTDVGEKKKKRLSREKREVRKGTSTNSSSRVNFEAAKLPPKRVPTVAIAGLEKDSKQKVLWEKVKVLRNAVAMLRDQRLATEEIVSRVLDQLETGPVLEPNLSQFKQMLKSLEAQANAYEELVPPQPAAGGDVIGAEVSTGSPLAATFANDFYTFGRVATPKPERKVFKVYNSEGEVREVTDLWNC